MMRRREDRAVAAIGAKLRRGSRPDSLPAREGEQSHLGASLTSPGSRGDVEICTLVAQIPGERACPQALSGKFAPGERPPHPIPLHSASKTGVNALMASGEREHRVARRDPMTAPA